MSAPRRARSRTEPTQGLAPSLSKSARRPRAVLPPHPGPATRRKLRKFLARSLCSDPGVIETFELPNVIGRSSADAGTALAEFKVERIEVVANAAPSGQVLAQDPAPGTLLRAGSSIGLQVSDGSLASASIATTAQGSASYAGAHALCSACTNSTAFDIPQHRRASTDRRCAARPWSGRTADASLVGEASQGRRRGWVPTVVAPTADAVTPHETTFEKAARPLASACGGHTPDG